MKTQIQININSRYTFVDGDIHTVGELLEATGYSTETHDLLQVGMEGAPSQTFTDPDAIIFFARGVNFHATPKRWGIVVRPVAAP